MAYPLRRVVGTKPGLAWVIEILECGHEQRQKTDIYGPTNAYRRRCRKCAQLGQVLQDATTSTDSLPRAIRNDILAAEIDKLRSEAL